MIDQGCSMACLGCKYKRNSDEYDSIKAQKQMAHLEETHLTPEQEEMKRLYEEARKSAPLCGCNSKEDLKCEV